MANEVARKESVALAPLDVMRQTVTALAPEFKAALPPQIPVERFIRTIITTLQMNPDLLTADRKSVLATCMKAAQDGLLLDGREAAAVMYGSKCQYLPMVAGILKKMRNSGDIASVDVQTVYQNDTFEYVLGDDAHITHKPIITGDRGPSICWYAIVKTKDGGITREVMNRDDIEKVRKVSKAKSEQSPWTTWYEEMAEKTVLKRISKRCPSSSDLEQVIAHDNEVIGFVQKGAESVPEKEVDARPTYLKMLGESEGLQDPGTIEESPVATVTEGGKPEIPAEVPVGTTAPAGVALPITPLPPDGAGQPVGSVAKKEGEGITPGKSVANLPASVKDPEMETVAKEAMTKAVGNRQLDAAWTKNVPANLKQVDPDAYKRLADHYNARLQSFKAK
jgi:recombination protein RecT